jgi:hypothetical protein
MNKPTAILVYQSRRWPYKSICRTEAECADELNPIWKHVATIDAATWIEYLLNNPAEREKHIEGIMT